MKVAFVRTLGAAARPPLILGADGRSLSLVSITSLWIKCQTSAAWSRSGREVLLSVRLSTFRMILEFGSRTLWRPFSLIVDINALGFNSEEAIRADVSRADVTGAMSVSRYSQ